MTVNDKAAYIANFNCTFGKEHEPMLTYFLESILPAFQDYDEKDGRKTFFFENVKLNNVKGSFALTGLIVKRTTLEVKSRYIKGKLTRTNELHPSDPYSYFLINLKNHRMVLVKNQKGSPTLVNFATTAERAIKKHMLQLNKEKKEQEKIPEVQLNIVAIPFKGTIASELKKVSKINNVILRFYPLNGDIMDNETVEHLTKSLEKLGSKTGNITYNTPDNKENVAKIIEDTKGLMRPTIKVEFKNGTKGTLRDGSFAEVMNIPLDETDAIGNNIDTIAGKVIHKEEFNETSVENKSIYDRFYTKLEKWYNEMLNI